MDDYTHKELLEIFKKKVGENEWSFSEETVLNENWFREKKDNFKNFGRDMELLFSCVKIKHGRRIYGQPVDLKKKLTAKDLDEGYQLFMDNKKKPKSNAFMHTIYV
jgi:hypothetical protein